MTALKKIKEELCEFAKVRDMFQNKSSVLLKITDDETNRKLHNCLLENFMAPDG